MSLNLEETQKIINNYMKDIAPINFGIPSIINQSSELKKQLEIVLSLTKNGIIAINTRGVITECNKSIEKIFGMKKENYIGVFVDKVLPELELTEVLKTKNTYENKLIRINQKDIVVSNYPIKLSGELLGAISQCTEFFELEDTQQKIRNKLVQKGYVAKYTFRDIIGKSNLILERIKLAKKMAKNDSTILITGDSGTGKELFAQAIHNESFRKNASFLAINCSALTENLLESELFGYEAGAFTGARKTGKPGLFELTHNGTIFLDEIGEISLNIQAKLLRVLEEKEIMRVGGSRIIKVNVRIIAATNKDLKELISRRVFREDLYYRLNVFPLNLPPLRDRKEDLPLIIEKFLKDENYEGKLADDILKILIEYKWKGNIRELQNCVKYMVQISEGEIEIEDIPDYVFNNVSLVHNGLSDKESKIIKELEFKRKYKFVLMILKDAYYLGNKIGRRTIYKKAKKDGINLSQIEIRRILKELEDIGLVDINIGRGGSIISKKGLDIVNGFKGLK